MLTENYLSNSAISAGGGCVVASKVTARIKMVRQLLQPITTVHCNHVTSIDQWEIRDGYKMHVQSVNLRIARTDSQTNSTHVQ